MTRVIIKQNNKEIIIPDTHETIKAIEQSMLSIQDALDGKESTSNRVTSLSYQSTDNQYPSAKAVIDAINNAANTIDNYVERKSNKVNTLSSESTITEYPSAKCVYDYIDSIMGDINDYITS